MEKKVLTAGIDTLVIGFQIERYLEEVNFDVLKDAKQTAMATGFNSKGTPVEWYGVDFEVRPSGSKGYEWILKNDDVMVCIAQKAFNGRVLPEVYVTFSSQYLWTMGYQEAFNKVRDWISKWAITNNNKVSRCDLCMDIAMPMPEIQTEKEMVTRARHKSEYQDNSLDVVKHYGGKRITDYTVGGGKLLARIYDKTTEILIHRKEWFRDIWKAEGWDEKESVVRCEFQCRREFLKEMKVDDFFSLTIILADIWHYCTYDWLRICDVGSKSNQSRWKEKDYWKLIQDSCHLFGKCYGFIREKVKQVKYSQIMKQLFGLIVYACALRSFKYGISVATTDTLIEIRKFILSPDFRVAVKKRIARDSNLQKEAHYLIDEIINMGGVIESIEDNPLRTETDKDSLN
jgi:hypothetical protein